MLVVAFSIILFLVFYFQNKITEKDKAYEFLFELTGELQTKVNLYNQNFEINNKMAGQKAPEITISGTKGDKSKFSLSDLIYKYPVLMYRFRYTDIYCASCYESEIKELQTEFSDTPELACILCSFNNDRDLTVLKKINVIILNMYRIPFEAFDWDVEKNGKPYYFVLHPDMKISHIFVPNNKYPEYNKQYLKAVKSFLSE